MYWALVSTFSSIGSNSGAISTIRTIAMGRVIVMVGIATGMTKDVVIKVAINTTTTTTMVLDRRTRL